MKTIVSSLFMVLLMTITTNENLAEEIKTATATFAGGCFWCMEKPFDQLEGVISTTSGYTGGNEPDPTYKEVSAGWTGHAEAVQVIYDPQKISYRQLLEIFWHNIDPTVKDRQFCDWGNQYRSAIFYHSPEQKKEALESREKLARTRFKGVPIMTEITAAATFYPAEEYHQNYYKKNPLRYKFYRHRCGRDQSLQEIWGEEAGSH
ncbi:MAG: peptide-methionine (S)-S-oxide reductase MsrA [Deltaproteobacteria bacterium]|nr:peptide-methionine (S)-S-oxide reductase MsrA [Deltaproteobacteria bacterium]